MVKFGLLKTWSYRVARWSLIIGPRNNIMGTLHIAARAAAPESTKGNNKLHRNDNATSYLIVARTAATRATTGNKHRKSIARPRAHRAPNPRTPPLRKSTSGPAPGPGQRRVTGGRPPQPRPRGGAWGPNHCSAHAIQGNVPEENYERRGPWGKDTLKRGSPGDPVGRGLGFGEPWEFSR